MRARVTSTSSGGSRMTLTNQDGDMSIGLESTGVGYVNVTDPFTMLTVPQKPGCRPIRLRQPERSSIEPSSAPRQNSRSNYISIGRNASGVGNVVVDGTGSILNTASSLRVGESGPGIVDDHRWRHGQRRSMVRTPLIGPPPPFMSIGTNATGVGDVLVDGIELASVGPSGICKSEAWDKERSRSATAASCKSSTIRQLTSTILVGPYGRIDLDGGHSCRFHAGRDAAAGHACHLRHRSCKAILGGSGLVRGTVQVDERRVCGSGGLANCCGSTAPFRIRAP